jgi:hypothetical protein
MPQRHKGSPRILRSGIQHWCNLEPWSLGGKEIPFEPGLNFSTLQLKKITNEKTKGIIIYRL